MCNSLGTIACDRPSKHCQIGVGVSALSWVIGVAIACCVAVWVFSCNSLTSLVVQRRGSACRAICQDLNRRSDISSRLCRTGRIGGIVMRTRRQIAYRLSCRPGICTTDCCLIVEVAVLFSLTTINVCDDSLTWYSIAPYGIDVCCRPRCNTLSPVSLGDFGWGIARTRNWCAIRAGNVAVSNRLRLRVGSRPIG